MCPVLFSKKACLTVSQRAEGQASHLSLIVSLLYMAAVYDAIPGRTTQMPFEVKYKGLLVNIQLRTG